MSETIPAELAIDDPPITEDDIDAELEADAGDAERRKDPWRITSLAEAEWAARRLAAAEATIAELGDQAREWVERIGVWLEAATRTANRDADFFDAKLQDYVLEERDRTKDLPPKEQIKSIKLPSATLTTNATNAAVEVRDEETAMAWTRANFPTEDADEIVKVDVTEKVLVSQLQARLRVVERETDAGDTELVVALGDEILDPSTSGLGVRPGHITSGVKLP